MRNENGGCRKVKDRSQKSETRSQESEAIFFLPRGEPSVTFWLFCSFLVIVRMSCKFISEVFPLVNVLTINYNNSSLCYIHNLFWCFRATTSTINHVSNNERLNGEILVKPVDLTKTVHRAYFDHFNKCNGSCNQYYTHGFMQWKKWKKFSIEVCSIDKYMIHHMTKHRQMLHK